MSDTNTPLTTEAKPRTRAAKPAAEATLQTAPLSPVTSEALSPPEAAFALPPSPPPSEPPALALPERPAYRVTKAARVALRAFQGTLYPGKRVNVDVYDLHDYDVIVRQKDALGLVLDTGAA